MTDSDFASITQDGKLCDAEGQMGQASRRDSAAREGLRGTEGKWQEGVLDDLRLLLKARRVLWASLAQKSSLSDKFRLFSVSAGFWFQSFVADSMILTLRFLSPSLHVPYHAPCLCFFQLSSPILSPFPSSCLQAYFSRSEFYTNLTGSHSLPLSLSFFLALSLSHRSLGLFPVPSDSPLDSDTPRQKEFEIIMRKQIRHMAQSKLCLTTLDRSAQEVYMDISYPRTLSLYCFHEEEALRL